MVYEQVFKLVGNSSILIIRASPDHVSTEYILAVRATIAPWWMVLLVGFS
jgi:hypothetical protein